MEKGTNTSRCPEAALGCNVYGSNVVITKWITNDGFRLQFDFNLTGFSLDEDEVRKISKVMSNVAMSILHSYETDKCVADMQPSLGLDNPFSDEEASNGLR